MALETIQGDSLHDSLLADAESPRKHPQKRRTYSGSRSRFHSTFDTIVNPNESEEATIMSSILNLTNTILGAGMLGLPYAVSKCGLPLGLSLFAVFGFLSGSGLHLLTAVGREIPDVSFTKASEETIPFLKTVVDIAVAIKCFGVGSSYLIVFGDLIPRVLQAITPITKQSDLLLNRRLWITVVFLVLIVPVVRFRQMDSLKFTSTIALLCMAYVTVIVLLFAFLPHSFPACDASSPPVCQAPVIYAPQSALEFISVVPIFIFAFTCHQNAFSITNELTDNTQNRLNRVILSSIAVCASVYCVVAYSGYKTYGGAVASDILNNYPESVPITILRTLLSVALAFSYPLQCHPCRKCLSQVFFKKEAQHLDNVRFYALTYSIAFASWILAMVVHNLGIVLAIVGATGSTTLSYILPGLFFFRFFETGQKRYFALALAVFGCLVVPFALTVVGITGKGG